MVQPAVNVVLFSGAAEMKGLPFLRATLSQFGSRWFFSVVWSVTCCMPGFRGSVLLTYVAGFCLAWRLGRDMQHWDAIVET
jgi:hypothetical protein